VVAEQGGGYAGGDGGEVGTEIGQRLHAQAGDRAVAPGGDLHVLDVVAPVGGGHVVLAPALHELDRAGQPLGGPGGDRHVRIEEDLGTEAAADLGRDHPQLMLGDPQHEGGQQDLHDMWALAGHPDSGVLCAGIVAGQGTAGLHGGGDQPLVADPLAYGHLGGVEGRGGCRLVAAVPVHAVHADVAGCVLVQLGCAGCHGLLGVDNRGEELVLHVDQLQGILGGVGIGGDHHRDPVADVADGADGQGMVGGDVVLHAPRGHRAGERVDLAHVLAGVDSEDARQGGGTGGVDGEDAGVGVRAAQDRGVGHIGEGDIVQVAAGAGDQAVVFLAFDALADERRGGNHLQTPCY